MDVPVAVKRLNPGILKGLCKCTQPLRDERLGWLEHIDANEHHVQECYDLAYHQV